MEKVIVFLKRIFVNDYRYFLWLQILLGVLIFALIVPNMNLSLKFLGIKDPLIIHRLSLKDTFLKLDKDLSLKPAGAFAAHKKYTFTVSKKLSKSEFTKVITVIATRFSYRNDYDIEINGDYKKKEIYISTNSKLDQSFVSRIVSSTGNYEVLKYVEPEDDSSIGFLSKENYIDLGLDRNSFTKVTKIAVGEKLPDDPDAKYEIRITLDKKTHEKIIAEATTSYFGVFVDDEFVGFLQNFSTDKYVISNLNTGDDFHLNYGRLKAPIITTKAELASITDVPAKFDSSTLQIIVLQIVFIAAIIVTILIVVYKYQGLVTAVTVLFSAELALLVMKLSRVSLSEYTLIGLFVAISTAMLGVLYYNSFLRKKDRDRYFFILLGGLLIVGSYLAQNFIETVHATFFISLFFVTIVVLINMLSVNNLLIEEKS